MAKLECFTTLGIELWFFPKDHLPPHFHAKRKGQWEVRVYFLESRTDKMFDVVWLKGKEVARVDTKLLEEMVTTYRIEIFEEWRTESETAMKTTSKTVRVIPYGRLIDRMQTFALSDIPHPFRVSKTWTRFEQAHELWHLLIAFSDELDEGFVRTFRERATRETRLLVLNDIQSSDRLLSHFVNLRIRSSHRFYVAEPRFAQASEENWEELIRSFLGRLTAGLESKENDGRILDARLEDGILNIVSTDFLRLEVPISKIVPLAKAEKETTERFEIDEDGSYIYWPDLDLHLGWEQLQQVINPAAVQRAKQKSREFNVRYGAAIRKMREEKGLAMTAIQGLSHKQLRRIERGESRLTSNTSRKLAQAHGMTPNDYLQAVATALQK
jgi:hypothetical protein